MLRESIDAFINRDTELAAKVLGDDDAVDVIHKKIMEELLSYMIKDPSCVSRAMNVMFISKYIERIGDHATNIGEIVIFMVKGKVIRHMKPDEQQ